MAYYLAAIFQISNMRLRRLRNFKKKNHVKFLNKKMKKITNSSWILNMILSDIYKYNIKLMLKKIKK